MRKRSSVVAAAAALCSMAMADTYEIATPNTTMLIRADQGWRPEYVYYGTHIKSADIAAIVATQPSTVNAYPAYGLDCMSEAAIAVRLADGNMTLDLRLENVDERNVAPTYGPRGDGHTTGDAPFADILASGTGGSATLTTFHLKDAVYPLYVDLCYKAYDDVDIIEVWSEVTNRDKKKAVTLLQYASAMLPVRVGNVWMSSLHGTWASEAQVVAEPLTRGIKEIKNKDGARNSTTSHAEVMLSLDGRPSELNGRTIAAALCYTGNYTIRVQTDDSDYHKLFAGICEDASPYTLSAGEKFVTPKLALTYSTDGLSGASRNLHRWGRRYQLAHADRLRSVLLNSWEGVYFDINEPGMSQMMEDIHSMGGELFVMDDGWFGDKYPRSVDNSSLGDWVADRRKLPHGIPGLVAEARRIGIDFGIWYEPEMSNTVSELYEKHPEWIIKAPQREPVLGRGGTQVVLDLANPKVQDFVVGLFDALLTENPELKYVKWDANAPISAHGSQYLTLDRQAHANIEYHRGFARVCDRIRAAHPDLTIQACASGGGRANWGMLPWFDEFWVSDNTDALQRIYMQWGTSYFFPAIAMASHISAVPNHTVFRTTSLKYRIDVAMSGRLGMEIQPRNMSDEERELCRKAIAEYKQIRPIVQMGDIYRLASPYDHRGVASLMYVSETRDKAVFYWWKTETMQDEHLPRIAMAGLDPDASYSIRELNRIDQKPLPFEGKEFSGAYLMANGLEIPYRHDVEWSKKNEWSSRVLLLEKQ